MPFAVAPVTLHGRVVRLEPLRPAHLDGLAAVGLDPALWEWTYDRITTRDEFARRIEEALAEEARGTLLPFVTVLAADGSLAGETRFLNIAPEHDRVEIGSTWVAPAWQRSAVNTEAKLLMLRHAFETWGCRRVELKTDALNARSRAAILRLGAVEEGTLRRQVRTATGRVRDTVYFSILDDEWPRVRERLEARLTR